MEDQNVTSRTINITGTTTTAATAGDLYSGYISNGPIITHYVDTDRITTNGDLYRDFVDVRDIVGVNERNGDECSNGPGNTFTRQYTYSMLEERIKALEERIEQIEEALMIESAKNLDSLIENNSGGEE